MHTSSEKIEFNKVSELNHLKTKRRDAYKIVTQTLKQIERYDEYIHQLETELNDD